VGGVQNDSGGGEMAKAKRAKKLLTTKDFAGDGEPYSEVVVTISIRILGMGITRSRLAVNVVPDPALEAFARKSLEALGKEQFGVSEEGIFGACLSENFDGWEDLNDDYPRMDENGKGRHDKDCLKAMNAYIKESVDWALAMNKQGMEEVARNVERREPGTPLVQ
jgi:hypothetical protein